MLLLFGAAFRGSAGAPLLLVGAAWVAIGLGGLWQRPRIAREVCLDGEHLRFVFPGREVTVAAGDVLEIRRARGDLNHWLWLRFGTASHGTLKVAARLGGAVALLAELHRLNPRLTYPEL